MCRLRHAIQLTLVGTGLGGAVATVEVNSGPVGAGVGMSLYSQLSDRRDSTVDAVGAAALDAGLAVTSWLGPACSFSVDTRKGPRGESEKSQLRRASGVRYARLQRKRAFTGGMMGTQRMH